MKRIILMIFVASIAIGCGSSSDTPTSAGTAPKGATPPGVAPPVDANK